MTNSPPAIIGVLQRQREREMAGRWSVKKSRLGQVENGPERCVCWSDHWSRCVSENVSLNWGDGVSLSGSPLIQSHVVPFEHQIPVKTYRHQHSQAEDERTTTFSWDQVTVA